MKNFKEGNLQEEEKKPDTLKPYITLPAKENVNFPDKFSEPWNEKDNDENLMFESDSDVASSRGYKTDDDLTDTEDESFDEV